MHVEEVRQPANIPGCGLAAFALLLLCIMAIGLTGVGVLTYSVFTGGEALSPTKFSYGGLVDPSILRPMRDAGLIGPTELPDAFHSENSDGTSACAISSGRLVRVGPDAQMPLSSIRAIEGTDNEVIAVGDTRITCWFGDDEGGDRFRRMLETLR